jgi:hypothetical protein
MVVPAPSRRHQELRLGAVVLFDEENLVGVLPVTGTVLLFDSGRAHVVYDFGAARLPDPSLGFW